MATTVTELSRLKQKIAVFAIFSRFILYLLQVILNIAIPDHDAGVFNPPEDTARQSFLGYLFDVLFSGFRRWDAIYFTHIAQHGYTYENTLAFFPMYPMLVWILSNSIFYPLQLVFSYGQVILLAGLLLNFYFFVQTAKCVFILGQMITKNDVIAYKAALLFCINPASIFMSAPYSETLYTYLSFQGMISLEKSKKLTASVLFGLSCATRSVGLLNIGFILHKICRDMYADRENLKRGLRMGILTFLAILWISVVFKVIPVCLYFCISVLPFLIYQYYCYALYCTQEYKVQPNNPMIAYGLSEGLKLYGDTPISWCEDKPPLAYSYIQKHYWDQGFLNYWQLKQMPNFLLAVPATVIVIITATAYFKHNRYIVLTLGMDERGSNKKIEDPSRTFYLIGVPVLPYIVHALLLTVFGWFCIHTQVLTRLLFSSNPVLYWSAAHLISGSLPCQPQVNKYEVHKTLNQSVELTANMDKSWKNLLTNQIFAFKSQTISAKLVLTYFIGYFVIGTALFCNFLPWT